MALATADFRVFPRYVAAFILLNWVIASASATGNPRSLRASGRALLADIREYFPSTVNARLLRARSVKEKRATFAPTPAVEALRPATTGPSGLILAGCYTATDWPATMEGATRSGYAAAAAVLGLSTASVLVPDMQASKLALALGLRRTDLSSLNSFAPLEQPC